MVPTPWVKNPTLGLSGPKIEGEGDDGLLGNGDNLAWVGDPNGEDRGVLGCGKSKYSSESS